jgi:hypothetical protein
MKDAKNTNWSGQSVVEESTVSSNTWNDLSSRWTLVVGDTLALLLFSAIGRSNHAEDINLLDTIITAAPFLISWFLISPFLGAFSRNATSSKLSAFTGIIPGWIVSVPIGLGIRGLIRHTVPPTPFIIVSMIATLLILSSWRFLYVILFGETTDKEYRKAGVFEVYNLYIIKYFI